MAWDLAIDYNTGDLKVGPSNDFQARVGPDTIAQRIRVRLRIPEGDWSLDPSDGELGSRMDDVLRMPTWRALTELELVVREALAPMDDIEVHNIVVVQKTANSVGLQIEYRLLFAEDETPISEGEILSTEIALTTPIE